MAKKFVVAFGDGAKTFCRKRDYLKWAVSTKAGWKHLMLLPLIALVWLRTRKDLTNEQKPVENNCPVMVETADGIPARCMFYMADGKTCPRHGDVSEIQKP